MAKRRNKRIPPENRTCSQCGETGTILKEVHSIPTAAEDVESVSPIYCMNCRDEIRHHKGNSIQSVRSVRIQTTDTRLQRWLTTRTGMIPQARHDPTQQWKDAPGLNPNNKPPQSKAHRCAICHGIATSTLLQIIKTEEVMLCDTCAWMLIDQPQRVLWKGYYGQTPHTVHLDECPGCGNPVYQRKPRTVCRPCLRGAIAMLNADGQRTSDRDHTLMKLIADNPRGRCSRCHPRSSKPPWTCPNCWEHYRNLPAGLFPEEEQVAWNEKRTCSLCEAKVATASANRYNPGTSQLQRVRLCRPCSRIIIQYRKPENGWITELSRCLNCGSLRKSDDHTDLCRKCQTVYSNAVADLESMWNYLYDVLESPPGRPVPEPNPTMKKWLRPDSTTRRADANVKGRLTPTLARQVCAEYLRQTREIPEIAIRFGVSVAVVKGTLTGKSWAAATEGLRPAELRWEPKRVKQAESEPPKSAKPTMITVSRIKGEYGWTDALIPKYLGNHDHEAPNPHHRTAAPMRLYLLERVHDAMAQNPQLREQLQKNLQRRATAHGEREERDLEIRQQLLEETDLLTKTIKVFLPTQELERLMHLATVKRREFLENVLEYGHYNVPQNDGSPEAKHRTVSMIHHEYTNYEKLLELMPRSRNADTNTLIYLAIRTKVMEAISKAIPSLANECKMSPEVNNLKFY